jgi:hypothetical protein
MPTTRFTRTLVQVLSGAAQETRDIPQLADRIRQMTETLYKLEDDKESVASRISAWDRLKFLSTTKDEQEEKDLKQRIKILKKELKLYHEGVESRLMELFLQLCYTRDDFRLLKLWNHTVEIKQKIRFIDCWGCDEGTAHVSGDMAAIASVTRLQEFLQFPADESVTVGFVIEEVKRALMGNY